MTKRNSTIINSPNQVKRTVCGVGYNSGGKHPIRENNKKTKLYSIWLAMIQRCYSDLNKQRHPTYKGCTVSDEWHDYQNFAEWYKNHEFYGLGYQLDKDLLVFGNKVYSANTCTLLPRVINNITLNPQSSNGSLPQGVYFDKDAGRYKAQINMGGKVVNLGRFNTIKEASSIYAQVKERHVRNTALEWANKIEWAVFNNLMNWRIAKPDSYSKPNLTPFVKQGE